MGVVLYEMLTGEVPFTGDSAVEIAMKQVNDAPPPQHAAQPADLAGLEQVVMRALAKDPALRFQSAREMADELERDAPRPGRLEDTQQATAVIGAAEATRVMAAGRGRDERDPARRGRPAAGAKRSALPWLLVLLLLARGRGRLRRLPAARRAATR